MAIRTIAIIAHVDHGKTTLVDELLKQSGTIQTDVNTQLIMDNNDQERERGITIYAKNTAIVYKDQIINIIDTPGHADFGSEVERVMRMVDSVLLVVDAYEGPMPQTKFVLKKAIERGLKPIVVINKIDKPTARPDRVVDQVFDLFFQLGATNEQADFPIIYTSAKNGYALTDIEDFDPNNPPSSIIPLLDEILRLVPPAPNYDDKPTRLQIVNLGYDDYVGRLGIGRIYEGTISPGQHVWVINNDGVKRKAKISKVYTTRGLQRIETALASSGDIVTIAGISDIFVGETIIGEENVQAMPAITIDEPTLTMEFLVNDSPFAGRVGKKVTSRNIEERLRKECETNVGLRVDFGKGQRFPVSGRGELHLSVLIESMRREGFELQVSAPQVIMKIEDGKKLEPIEHVVLIVADELSGGAIDALSQRKGVLKTIQSMNGVTTIEMEVPTRGLLGFRGNFVLMTKGEGIMYSSFSHCEPYKGEIPTRQNGSLISMETGIAMRYSIWKLQERGTIFVEPGEEIYEGQIVGESAKPGDMTINLTKNKQLTNIRAQGHDEAMRLQPIRKLSLEDALGYIGSDEYVEITPAAIRIRKIHLTESDRARFKKGLT